MTLSLCFHISLLPKRCQNYSRKAFLNVLSDDQVGCWRAVSQLEADIWTSDQTIGETWRATISSIHSTASTHWKITFYERRMYSKHFLSTIDRLLRNHTQCAVYVLGQCQDATRGVRVFQGAIDTVMDELGCSDVNELQSRGGSALVLPSPLLWFPAVLFFATRSPIVGLSLKRLLWESRRKFVCFSIFFSTKRFQENSEWKKI